MHKIYTRLLLLTLLSLSFITGSAQNNFFTDIAESKIPQGKGNRVIVPQKFRTIEVSNHQAMKSFLWSLPQEKDIIYKRKETPIMEFPMPDGRMAKFHVWESSIQEPALEAKFPDIKTFSGQGIDDPYASVRFDYTPSGFHAQILTIHGSYYIDPYARGLVNEYMSYFRTDYQKTNNFICDVEDNPDANRNPITEAPCRGNEMKVYRVAIACTGEYAQAPGVAAGTNATTLHAAIVTTTNRVVGVYERDITVKLVLIANNNLIEYLNAATDPFNGNNNANTLINESQTVIDANIGFANYDIGHTFSTGGGGLAQLNSPCGSSKARGITGSPQPTGDPYDIDYVAHEMGHQLGGNHTMAGCGLSPNSTKVEVGSGTSIQAYAGICGAENIQPNSDPYFHSKSFDEISTFLAGGGAGCGVITPTGNNVPVIDPLSLGGVSIPIGTPFTLSGTATDPDGDPLTYSWEQMDFSSTATWNAGATAPAGNTVPLFKMRLPKTTGVRSFPDPAVIAAGFPANPPSAMDGLKGETLSPVERPMTFRLVVRDGRAAGGGVASSGSGGCQSGPTFQVNIVNSAPFVVTAPTAAGLSYPGLSTQTVTWNVSNTNVAPIAVSNVKISLSTDGGLTYPTVLLASTANDGTEVVTIPAVSTTTAKIKVEAIGNVFFDVSDNNFAITQPIVTYEFVTPAATNVPCGSGTTATSTLSTTSVGGFTTPITLSATAGVPAGTTVAFGTNPVAPGSSSTVVLNNVNTLTPGTYNVTVTGVAGAVTKTVTVAYVVPVANPIITTQPVATAACATTTASFNVAATGAISYKWQLSTDGTTWADITGATSATYVTAALAVGQNGHRYRVIVTGLCGSTTSNAAVLTVNTPVAITAQPVNDQACIGDDASFSVTATGSSITYQWQVSIAGGAFANVSNGGGYTGATTATLNITTPVINMSGNRYRVVVSGVPCGSVNSNAATLTVNQKPGVILVVAESNNLTPYTPAGLYSTVSPSTGTYSYVWRRDGSVVTSATTSSIPVNVDGFGEYDVTATDQNGCSITSNKVTVSDSVSNIVFVYPNPNDGRFQVRYYSATPTDFSVNVYNSNGKRVWSQQYPVTARYQQMIVDLRKYSSGIYSVEVRDRNGKRLANSSVLIQK